MAKYSKTENYDEASIAKMSSAFTEVITQCGEDTNREGLLKTPERAAKAMQFLTHGYDLNPRAILESALFNESYS